MRLPVKPVAPHTIRSYSRVAIRSVFGAGGVAARRPDGVAVLPTSWEGTQRMVQVVVSTSLLEQVKVEGTLLFLRGTRTAATGAMFRLKAGPQMDCIMAVRCC